MKQFIIVTGMSGAGKTMTLKVLEDFGFTTIDNLPPELLPQLFTLLEKSEARGVVVTVDVRNADGDLVKVIDEVSHAWKGTVKVLFLTASDEELLRRYERTRRVHPLSKGLSRTGASISRSARMLSRIESTLPRG